MILERMLAKLHLKAFLVTLAVLVVLAVVMEFFESARHLLSGKGSALDVLLYCLCRAAELTVLLMPIALVVSVCVSDAVLGRNLELRALASAGIGPVRMSAPLLVLALGVVAASMLMAEFVVPAALDEVEELMSEKFGRIDSTWRFFRNHHWYQGEGERIFQVTGRTPDGKRIRFITLLEMNDDFQVARRTEVKHARWVEDHWVGKRVNSWQFADGAMVARGVAHDKVLDWPEKPERFRDLRGRPKQKSFARLKESIHEMERRGFEARQYRLELNMRFAVPVLALCMVLLAFPFLAVPSRRRTLAGALTESIGLIFCAYFLVTCCTAAVSGGLLAAGVGAWIPPLTILAAAAPGWISLFKHHFARSVS